MADLRFGSASYRDERETVVGMVAVSWSENGFAHSVGMGFGWDQEHPFRPWPRLTTTPSPGGNDGWCASWCGVFVNVRWRKMTPPTHWRCTCGKRFPTVTP